MSRFDPILGLVWKGEAIPWCHVDGVARCVLAGKTKEAYKEYAFSDDQVAIILDFNSVKTIEDKCTWPTTKGK